MSSTQASIPASTIDSDAAGIYNLTDALYINSPKIFHQLQALVCEMINNCCPAVKPTLGEYVTLMTPDNSDALSKVCLGDDPQSALNTCPTMQKIVTAAQDKDLEKYATVLSTALSGQQLPNIAIQRPCSADEAYAALCDWSQRQQVQSCQRKILVNVAQNNTDDAYRTYVQQTKKNLGLLTDAVKQAFSQVNVIKITTRDATVS